MVDVVSAMLALRARYSVMPSRKYAAQVHNDCQLSKPSLNMAKIAVAANRAANVVSAIGRIPDFGRLNSANVPNGTTAMVRLANGKSRQRGSNNKPSAVSAASSVVTVNTNPRTIVGTDGVLSSRGPINSRNVGSARPDIRALAHNRGDAIAAASSE